MPTCLTRGLFYQRSKNLFSGTKYGEQPLIMWQYCHFAFAAYLVADDFYFFRFFICRAINKISIFFSELFQPDFLLKKADNFLLSYSFDKKKQIKLRHLNGNGKEKMKEINWENFSKEAVFIFVLRLFTILFLYLNKSNCLFRSIHLRSINAMASSNFLFFRAPVSLG